MQLAALPTSLTEPLSGGAVLDFQKEAISQGLPFADAIATPEAGFGTFLSGIIGAILVVAVLMVLLYLIWGAIEWISSGGDKAKAEKARNRMTQAVTGLIVMAASLAIITLVQSFLGVSILNFGGGSSGGGTGGGGTTGICAIGQTGSDSGAGGYCTGGGAARMRCLGPTATYPYNHWDPVSCISGSKSWDWKSGT